MFQDLDTIYARFQQAENIPGLVFGVIQGGNLAYVKGLGVASLESKAPVEPETFFRIASMTKCVTSLAVLLLRDRGKLALDANVADLVPSFAKLRLPTADSRTIPGAIGCSRSRWTISTACWRRACISPGRRASISNMQISAIPCSAAWSRRRAAKITQPSSAARFCSRWA
jgi:hypothetical protein